MSNMEYDQDDLFEEDDILNDIKILQLTRNEALYLSDSVTLLMEHTPEAGRLHVPARQLMPQAGVPVPLDLIQKIGLAVLLTTDIEDEPSDTLHQVEVTIADLFLLRECCQSFVKVNQEMVGFNLLKKIYELVLDEDMKERRFFKRITKGMDIDLSAPKEKQEERNESNG